MVEEVQSKTFYKRDDATGTIVEYDMETGLVVRQSQTAQDKLLDPGSPPRTVWKYTEGYGHVICEMIAGGKTFKAICELSGMPTIGVLAMWRASEDDFRNAIQIAKKMRAEHFHDMIVEDLRAEAEAKEGDPNVSIDENKISKDQVQARKLKMDRLKWLASVNDPDTFGNKTKVSGDAEAPLQLIVSTGITRE